MSRPDSWLDVVVGWLLSCLVALLVVAFWPFIRKGKGEEDDL